jgi:hypothetical protein
LFSNILFSSFCPILGIIEAENITPPSKLCHANTHMNAVHLEVPLQLPQPFDQHTDEWFEQRPKYNQDNFFVYNNLNDEKKVKSCAVKVAKTLIHECFGHNKYIYNSPKIIDSPLRFFNNENNLVTIISPTSYANDNEFIMKGSYPDKGESGKFLEFFFGHYEQKMIISLIFEIDDISKLYDSVDYFVKDDLSEVRKYIIMKYVLKNRGYNYKENCDYNLEEENKNLESVFNNKYKDDLSNIKSKIFDRSKSNDDISEVIFLSKSKIKGCNYYRNKAIEESNLSKKAEYLWELLSILKS